MVTVQARAWVDTGYIYGAERSIKLTTIQTLQNLRSYNQYYTTASISWDPYPEICDGNGNVLYEFQVFSQDGGKLLKNGTTNTTVVNIAGLDCGTSYRFRVSYRTRNGVGPGALSSFSTYFPYRLHAPDVSLLAKSNESLTFTWEGYQHECLISNDSTTRVEYEFQLSDNEFEDDGIWYYYTYYYSSYTLYEKDILMDTLNETFVTIQEFKPGTDYWFRVRALLSSASGVYRQYGDWSLQLYATTLGNYTEVKETIPSTAEKPDTFTTEESYTTEQPTTTAMVIDSECPDEYVYLMTEASVSIQSFGYPSSYMNNMRCHCRVTPASMKRVLVKFLDLDLESCCDHLYIGNNTFWKALAYTGSSVPQIGVLSAVNGSLDFEFKTDRSVTRNGFSLLITNHDIEDEVFCSNGFEALEEFLICNGIAECTDGSDESDCDICSIQLNSEDIDLHPEYLSVKWQCESYTGDNNQFQVTLHLVNAGQCNAYDDTGKPIHKYISPWEYLDADNLYYGLNFSDTQIYANSTYQISIQSRVRPQVGAAFHYGEQKSVNVTTSEELQLHRANYSASTASFSWNPYPSFCINTGVSGSGTYEYKFVRQNDGHSIYGMIDDIMVSFSNLECQTKYWFTVSYSTRAGVSPAAKAQGETGFERAAPQHSGVRLTDGLDGSLSFAWDTYDHCSYTNVEYEYELRSIGFGLVHKGVAFEPYVTIENLQLDTEYMFRVAVTAFYRSDNSRSGVWSTQWSEYLNVVSNPVSCRRSTDFRCANTRCIPSGRRCDGVNDCRDNSDEINCPPE